MGKRVLFTLALLMSMIGGYSAFAQASRVTGVVVDNYSDPVIGASVLVKGTTVGTITDVNGSFTLNEVPKGKNTLVVSYIGMKTQEVAIKPNLTIRLQEDSQMMEEVVVQVAYGAAKKTSLTGAVTSVDSKVIDKRVATTAMNALEGTAAGVQVNNTIGQPGQTATIRIRGIGSYNSSSTPLYVIDGVPMGAESSADINPADIESMTVLKDGASAALYGNRAANGVILITTKKGSAGKVNTELRISQGVYQRGTKDYKRLNVKQFMEASWLVQRNMYMKNNDYSEAEAAEYVSSSIIDDVLYINPFAADKASLFNADGTLRDVKMIKEYAEDLDWYDACLRNGMRSEYTLSSSFGTDKASTFYSLGYLDENGYTKDARFTRYTGRINSSSKLTKWLKTGLDLSGVYSISDSGSGSSSSDSTSSTNLFYWGRNIAPIYPVHLHNEDGSYRLDSDGKRQYDMGEYEGDDGVVAFSRNWNRTLHPLAQQELNLDRTWSSTLRATAYAEIYFLKDFTFTTKVSGLSRNTERRNYLNPTIGSGQTLNGYLTQTQYRYTNYTAQEILQWKHTFNKHFVDVMVGHENYYYRYDYNYSYVTDQTLDTGIYLSNFSTQQSIVGYGSGYVTEGYLARIRYNYNEKYNVETSFRRDGSSRVSPTQRWGNFYSIGANWIVSEEEFMKQIKWVDMLKLRASWGQVGIDATSSYFGFISLATVTSMDDNPVYYIGTRGNESLSWETAETIDFALETRLFDRWNIQVEYFEKRNKDLLFSVNQPLSQGTLAVYSSSPWAVSTTQNIGTMKNWGWEISTDVDVYRDRNWKVNLGMNASFIRNKFVKLPDQMMANGGTTSGNYIITEGKSRYTWYMYTWAGVDQMNGRSLYLADFGTDGDYYTLLSDGTAVGNTSGTYIAMSDEKTGDANVVCVDGNYYVYNTTYARKEMHGQALPKAYGGINANISYKDITFSALFTYRLGGKVYDGIYDGLMSSSTTTNMHKDVLKSWRETPEGITETSADRIDPNGIPQLTGYSDYNTYNNATSSRFLTSGNYFVIKNVNISYALPKRWLQPLGVRGVSVSGAIENLATFTARQGLNPQISLSGEVSSNYLTVPRTFVFGLNIKL